MVFQPLDNPSSLDPAAHLGQARPSFPGTSIDSGARNRGLVRQLILDGLALSTASVSRERLTAIKLHFCNSTAGLLSRGWHLGSAQAWSLEKLRKVPGTEATHARHGVINRWLGDISHVRNQSSSNLKQHRNVIARNVATKLSTRRKHNRGLSKFQQRVREHRFMCARCSMLRH